MFYISKTLVHVFLMYCLLNQSVLELHVVKMIVIFIVVALSDLILYSFSGQSRQVIWFRDFCFVISFPHFLYKSQSFARTQVKIQIVKFRLLSIDTLISGASWVFFLLMSNIVNYDYLFLCQLKHNWCPSHTPPPIPFVWVAEWDRNFEFESYKNAENKFIGNITCITHFVVIYAHLKTAQI